MILYNVTIKVENAIAASWLSWMLEEHIPEVMQTGCFTRHQVVRLLETDDSEGPTYAVQYFAATEADYQRYLAQHAPEMRRRSAEKWGDHFIAFRSVMEVVQ
jgi:hypothetical protein